MTKGTEAVEATAHVSRVKANGVQAAVGSFLAVCQDLFVNTGQGFLTSHGPWHGMAWAN